MSISDNIDWNELSRYAANKKLDFLVDEEDEKFTVRDVEGYEGLTDEEIIDMTKHETMWMCLCLLYQASRKYGLKTFKLSAIDQEEINEIPYFINEMPNGDKYLTFDYNDDKLEGQR